MSSIVPSSPRGILPASDRNDGDALLHEVVDQTAADTVSAAGDHHYLTINRKCIHFSSIASRHTGLLCPETVDRLCDQFFACPEKIGREFRPVRRIREILRLQAECAADEVYEYFDTADALGLLVEVKEHY